MNLLHCYRRRIKSSKILFKNYFSIVKTAKYCDSSQINQTFISDKLDSFSMFSFFLEREESERRAREREREREEGSPPHYLFLLHQMHLWHKAT